MNTILIPFYDIQKKIWRQVLGVWVRLLWMEFIHSMKNKGMDQVLPEAWHRRSMSSMPTLFCCRRLTVNAVHRLEGHTQI